MILQSKVVQPNDTTYEPKSCNRAEHLSKNPQHLLNRDTLTHAEAVPTRCPMKQR